MLRNAVAWFFVASFIPWFLIDRVGRRPLASSRHYPICYLKLTTPSAPIDDIPDVRRNGRLRSPDLPSATQHFHSPCIRHRRRSNALRLPRCLHHRFPSYRLGLPDRNPAPETPAKGLFDFDGGELDLQLHYCADYATGDHEYWMADIYYFCNFECYVGAGYICR